MLIHRRDYPSIKFAGTYLYTLEERGIVTVTRFVPNKLSYKIFYLVAWLSWPGHLKASPKKPWNRIQNWKHDFGSP